MAKRVKTVFRTTKELAAAWCAQDRETAAQVQWSVPGCGRFNTAPKGTKRERTRLAYFEGARLYSYGRHYLLGYLTRINGKQVALVNATRWIRETYSHSTGGYRKSVSHATQAQKSAVVDAARAAGFEVVEYHHATEGIELAGLDFATCDNELAAAISETLHRENAAFFDRLAEISYAPENAETVSILVDELRGFNARVSSLGFPELEISVPAEYLSDAKELGAIQSAVRKDHLSRKQTIFKISEMGTKLVDVPCNWGRAARAMRRRTS